MTPDPKRTWQIIAQELAAETDPSKIQKLATELGQVLAKLDQERQISHLKQTK
jgi:hypothetical protein